MTDLTPAPIRYPLATNSWGEEEPAALREVLDSQQYTLGARVARFETEFAAQMGSRYAVMVNSGSSANLLMVAAACLRRERPLQPGDEVLVPAVSWATSYYPFAQYQLRLRFVDIDPQTLNYDLRQLAGAVTDKTRALLAVNLLGNPNDFEALTSFARDRGLLLLEDNCESLGARFAGRYAGTFGEMGTFSTFFSHHLSTMEGGLIVTDDRELYELLLSLRSHGWTRPLPKDNLVSGTKSEEPFEELFRFVVPGYNVRPLEMEAAVGSVQLAKLPRFLSRRRANAVHFRARLGNSERWTLQRELGESSWFGFSLVLTPSSGLDRREVLGRLGQAGIETRPIVGGNFTKNPVMRWLPHSIHGELAHADYLDRHGFFVGNQETDLTEAIDHLATILQQL